MQMLIDSGWAWVVSRWLSILILTLSAGALIKFPKQELISPFAQSVFGAVLVGLLLDHHLKRELLLELVRDAAHVLIGFEMPSLLRYRIQQLIKATEVRHDWTVRYRLEAAGSHVRVHVDSSYHVTTYAGKPTTYHPILEFEQLEKPAVREMRCDSDQPDAQFCIPNPQSEVTDRVVRFRGPEIRLKPGKSYPFRLIYSIEGPREGSDIFVFGGPSLDVTFEAEESSDFEFDLVIGSEETDVVVTPRRWKFNRAFIESQHIRVRWKPKVGDVLEESSHVGSPA